MIRGVEKVTSHIVEANDWIARKQIKGELRDIIFAWFKAL
jgi:hypothetical protein